MTKMETPLGVLAISLNKMKELANKQSEIIDKVQLMSFNITIDSILSIIEDNMVLSNEKALIEHAYEMGKLEAKMGVESSGEAYFNENYIIKDSNEKA